MENHSLDNLEDSKANLYRSLDFNFHFNVNCLTFIAYFVYIYIDILKFN